MGKVSKMEEELREAARKTFNADWNSLDAGKKNIIMAQVLRE